MHRQTGQNSGKNSAKMGQKNSNKNVGICMAYGCDSIGRISVSEATAIIVMKPTRQEVSRTYLTFV